MYYYKYYRPGDIQFGMLSRGEFFFASAEELNDGSECRSRYVLKGSAELWHRLSAYILFNVLIYIDHKLVSQDVFTGLSEQLGNSLKKRAGRRDVDIEEFWEYLWLELPHLLQKNSIGISQSTYDEVIDNIGTRIRRHLNKNLFMTSLSRTPCDPTMWGHYADADKGFCLVIHAPENKLKIMSPAPILDGERTCTDPIIMNLLSPDADLKTIGKYKEEEVTLEAIIYISSPPRINAFKRLIPHFYYSEQEDHYDVPLLIEGDAPKRQEQLFGRIKAKTWRYEQEVRAFLPAFDNLTPEARCLQINWDQIQGVILGPKMSRENRKRTIVACHLLQEKRANTKRSRPFIFFEAKQQATNFEMKIFAKGGLNKYYSEEVNSLKKMDDENLQSIHNILKEMNL